MTNEQIKHLKELHEKATPGPWIEGLVPHDVGRIFRATAPTHAQKAVGTGPYIDRGLLPVGIDTICNMQVSNSPNFREDAAFIAELRNSFPALIEELEYWKRVAEQAMELLDVELGCGQWESNSPDLIKALAEDPRYMSESNVKAYLEDAGIDIDKFNARLDADLAKALEER